LLHGIGALAHQQAALGHHEDASQNQYAQARTDNEQQQALGDGEFA